MRLNTIGVCGLISTQIRSYISHSVSVLCSLLLVFLRRIHLSWRLLFHLLACAIVFFSLSLSYPFNVQPTAGIL